MSSDGCVGHCENTQGIPHDNVDHLVVDSIPVISGHTSLTG